MWSVLIVYGILVETILYSDIKILGIERLVHEYNISNIQPIQGECVTRFFCDAYGTHIFLIISGPAIPVFTMKGMEKNNPES